METKNISAANTMNRIKEKKNLSDWMRKERDKRRRKMIVDQQKLQREIEVKKREQLVIEKLKQESRQEKEIEYEIWRSMQGKQIIIEDRNLRNEKYKQKQEIIVQNAKYKEEEMLRVLRQENVVDFQQKLIREKELQISYKQQIHRFNYEVCENLISKLVELADSCYNHQQNNDSTQIDQRFWNEQIRLFIDGKPTIPCVQMRTFDPIINLKLQDQNPLFDESKDLLCQKEIIDYKEGKGQWVPQHNFEQPPQDPEMDEKYTPNKPLNNFYLGNVVVKMLCQIFPQDLKVIQNVNQTNPDLLAIKVIIMGYQFSGKKSMAECLNKKYNLSILSISKIISDLMNKLKQYQDQLQAIQNQKFMQTDKQSGQSRSSARSSQANQQKQQQQQEQQEQKLDVNMDEDTLQLANEIKGYLLKGQNIPDEVYVKVIMSKIRENYPRQSEEEFLQEYNQIALPQLVQQEKQESDLTIPLTKEDIFKQNLINQLYKYTKGWILLDFPHTYEQAKLLERELSQFKPRDEIQKTTLEARLESAALIANPTESEKIKMSLLRGGVDYVFHIDISSQESLRRTIGRRFDANTRQMFHLEDNPPPVDNAPLIERLEQIRDFETAELAMVDKNNDLDNNIDLIRQWYKSFGFQVEISKEQKNKLDIILKRDNANKQNSVNAQNNLKTNENNIEIDNNQGYNNNNIIIEQQDLNNQDNITSQVLEEGQQVQKTDNQEQLELVEMNTWQRIDGQQKIDELFYTIDNYINILLDYKQKQYKAIEQKKQREIEQQKEKEEIQRIIKENENKLLPTDQQEVKQQIEKIQKQFKLNPDALNNLYNLWTNIEKSYLKDTKQIFRKLRDHRELIYSQFSAIQRRFLELVQRQDNKFYYMRNYQIEYNKFVEENRDMCETEVTKEELHQRVEDLQDILFDIIECKKEDLNEERNQIMKSGWIENEMERFLFNIQYLLQIELSRSFNCIQLLFDYYQLMNQQELTEIPEYYKNDIVQNIESLPPVENDNGQSFPRLEKLIENTQRLFNGEEEQDDKAKKGGKAAKKEDKKAAKKGGKDEPEEKKELSPQEIEMKKAINTEKAIFRYRINVIKDFATSRLKEMRTMAQVLYNKLQDWITYTVKVENKAMNDMAMIFRDAIEQEEKIQKEIQLNYVDVIISHEKLNYMTPPPIIFPAREEIFEDRFSISQLYMVIEELKGLSNQQYLIESSLLLQLFNRKTLNQLSVVELPQIWKQYIIKNYQVMISKLDPKKTGYINSKDLCTYICLLRSTIISNDEEKVYRENLNLYGKNGQIDRQGFTNTDAYFDQYEYSSDEPNTNLFDRVRYIKELLFYIHKNTQTDLMDIELFLNSLSGRKYISEEEKLNNKNYNELMFKL